MPRARSPGTQRGAPHRPEERLGRTQRCTQPWQASPVGAMTQAASDLCGRAAVLAAAEGRRAGGRWGPRLQSQKLTSSLPEKLKGQLSPLRPSLVTCWLIDTHDSQQQEMMQSLLRQQPPRGGQVQVSSLSVTLVEKQVCPCGAGLLGGRGAPGLRRERGESTPPCGGRGDGGRAQGRSGVSGEGATPGTVPGFAPFLSTSK